VLAVVAVELSNPDLDVMGELVRADAMAAKFTPCAPANSYLNLAAFCEYFHEQLGFDGVTEEYYTAPNSLLPDVLNLRRGIPISLSLVFQAIAWRTGLEVKGVAAPGHFLLRFDVDELDAYFIDPYHQCHIMDEREALLFLRDRTGLKHINKAHLQPADPDAILYRYLENLALVYRQRGNKSSELAVKKLQCLLRHADGEDWLNRASLEHLAGNFRDSATSYTRALLLGVERHAELKAQSLGLNLTKEHLSNQ
jgi:regulator of sirC expression with transglutaminase-like and TPR domain